MRKLAIFLLLLLVPLALAGEHAALKVGDSSVEQDWNITILRTYADKDVLMQVFLDPNQTITKVVVFNTTTRFDGINITTTDVFHDDDEAFTSITFTTEVLWTNLCDDDKDCEDTDACTIDSCVGYPLKCDWTDSHKNITFCYPDDGCCPSSCSWRTDNDCPLQTCDGNWNCNDNNVSTNDTCGDDDVCVFTEIDWCKSGDNACPDNCTNTLFDWDNRDTDCSKDSECIGHIDCDDENDSTEDLCWTEPPTDPKICSNSEIIGKITVERFEGTTPRAATEDIEYNQPPAAEDSLINSLVSNRDRQKNLIILFSSVVILLIVYLAILYRKFKAAEV